MLITQTLHKGWSVQQSGKKETYPALVPGCVHTDLHRAGAIPDPFWGRNEDDLQWMEEVDWEYETTFDADEDLLKGEHIELVAEGLDTLATITLNGEVVAESRNMFAPLRVEVKKHLKATGNHLHILFSNPMAYIRDKEGKPIEPITCDRVGGRYHIRKEQCSFGWDWGPRFSTSGIWRPFRLEAWRNARLVDYHLTQKHDDGKVTLGIAPEITGNSEGTRLVVTVELDGKEVAQAEASCDSPLEVEIPQPRLWWPNHHGEQPLYTVTIVFFNGQRLVTTRSQRIGLCEVKLDRHKDEWGESFQFVVNGRTIFAKGANWIPAHSFVNEGDALATDALDSARDANMNMIRVWGGGIYEDAAFMEKCLERGLLVWHDFMFACCPYPGDDDFLGLVRAEAETNIKALRNYANLALWCGNNEIIQLFGPEIAADPVKTKAYEDIFHNILPAAVEKFSPEIDYWPTSEWNPQDPLGKTNNQDSGDAHYWGVWHSREPVEAYEKQLHRFFSEFGMQAYPCPETVATFTDSRNVFGPEFDNHQKNGGGNAIIFHYCSSLYRFPKDFEATLYLSQLNQAYCLRTGIEHMRRNMPRTMGALYWQINDCWPVASWSSLDFGGRWKVLHYTARRFFAPALISVKRIGEETIGASSNHIYNDISAMQLTAVYDGPEKTKGAAHWTLWSVSKNAVVKSGKMDCELVPDTALELATLDFQKEVDEYGREDLILRTRLEAEGYLDSYNTTFFTMPKRVEFARPAIEWSVEVENDRTFYVTLNTDKIAYQVFLNLREAAVFRTCDNAFELFPGEPARICITTKEPYSAEAFKKLLTVYSYRDSYDD